MIAIDWAWSHIFNNICEQRATVRQVKLRSSILPWITRQIRQLMNLRFKTLLKAKETNYPEQWVTYRELRNKVTLQVIDCLKVIIIWNYLMRLRILKHIGDWKRNLLTMYHLSK